MSLPTVANLFSLTTKRVTDLVLEQSREAFRMVGIELDAKMTSIITLLHQSGPLTSTELATETGLSRQLVESRLRKLVRKRYLDEAKDPTDLRRRVYAIAATQERDVERVLSTIGDFERVYERVWDELGFDLQQGLRELEALLESKPLVARLLELKPNLLQPTSEGDRS